MAWSQLWLVGALLFALMPAIGASQIQPAAQETLTLDKIFVPGGMTGRPPESIEWSPDGTKITFIQRDAAGEHGQLWIVDAATGNKSVLIPESKLQTLAPAPRVSRDHLDQELVRRHGAEPYQWSPDSKQLLFKSRGQLWLYSLENGVAIALTTSVEPPLDPQFSPDGKRVAFVRSTDLWTRSADEHEDQQLTRKSEDEDHVLIGGISWVYARELGVRSDFSWSPDGKHIAFLQVDERGVPTYPLVNWASRQASVLEQKYPQPGDINPVVRVGVVSSSGGKLHYVRIPGEPATRDLYIPRFGWLQDGVLYVEVLNRGQDTLTLYFADADSGRAQPVLTEKSPDSWVHTSYDLLFAGPGKFLWSSWRSGNNHIYLYGFDPKNPLSREATMERQLTAGNYQVEEINAFDPASQSVFFTANADDPRETQLYSVKLNGTDFHRVSRAPGTHEAMFSPDASRYVETFSSLLTPPQLSLCDVSGNCKSLWTSSQVQARLPLIQELELKAADGQTTLYGYLMLPRHINQAAPHSVPVVLNPSGSPETQGVRHVWGGEGFLFNSFLSEENGCAILVVDSRGTANRGRSFATAIRGELGDIELKDQLAALDQVLQRYPALDSDRIGWYGSGYGGFLTLYAMTHSDRIRAGVAVSPITNWVLYDSIFTERYLGDPRQNGAEYDRSSPTEAAARLSGRLLLVHGTADRNVHVQNTFQMVDALGHADIDFDLQLYFGIGSSFPSAGVRKHLYHRIQRHLYQWLQDERY
jgi:dipeptidyl-peptidase 4